MPDITMQAVDSEKAYLDLKSIALKTGDLPPIPSVALTALQMTKDPETSARALQTVIIRDQALAAKILRIVNSAMYCLTREVSTISHAVAVLGMDTIRSIIMAASVQGMFQSGMVQGRDLGTKLLADHSWGAAMAARLIARETRYPNPEEAFVSALMHDLGKAVLLKNFRDRYTSIITEVYSGLAEFHPMEMTLFGFSHAHVGALLAQKWNFPPQLAEAIGFHHDPGRAPNFGKLACVVSLANFMMVQLEIGFERNRNLDIASTEPAQILGLGENAIASLVPQVQSSFAATAAMIKV